MALDPPVTTPVLSEVIRSGGERWTMDRVLEQCPSLRAAMALPRDAWPDAGCQSVVLQGATLDAAEFLLGEIRCQFTILGGEIRCQFTILARKDEPTPD